MNELERLKAELERVQKQAAALREALEHLASDSTHMHDACEMNGVVCSLAQARRILSSNTDAGRDFISRESVKPLVEALRATTSQVCSSDPWHQKVAAEKTGQEALEHARTLGL